MRQKEFSSKEFELQNDLIEATMAAISLQSWPYLEEMLSKAEVDGGTESKDNSKFVLGLVFLKPY